MAISTAGTYLEYKATQGAEYAKLVDIISYPDMGATPSKLDTTDQSALTYKTSILGLQEIPDLSFECNYDESAYNTIVGLAGDVIFLQLRMGTTDGNFTWKGEVSVFVNGAGVDEVRKMTVTCSAETEIAFA